MDMLLKYSVLCYCRRINFLLQIGSHLMWYVTGKHSVILPGAAGWDQKKKTKTNRWNPCWLQPTDDGTSKDEEPQSQLLLPPIAGRVSARPTWRLQKDLDAPSPLGGSETVGLVSRVCPHVLSPFDIPWFPAGDFRRHKNSQIISRVDVRGGFPLDCYPILHVIHNITGSLKNRRYHLGLYVLQDVKIKPI